MNGDIGGRRLQRLLVLLVAISLQSISGLADDPANPKAAANAEANPSSSDSKTGREVFLIGLSLVGAVVLAVFLFKLWQKKKREEQHARLLKLFEEDDELELELGLRD
ncbi:hypothetical protein Cni_G12347 [Canna indica]|uniref:Transmembrane protein n=1 Tax=Canna indica TaxID=4628 RepID=A0AAQ3K802_9LILI|nr:hypothetical protein Cni_G12347 [Canna indica]